MDNKIFKLLMVAVLIGPTAAIAQITTLFYQGDFMTGTSTYLPTGLTFENGNVILPTATTIGAFTASLVVDGSIKANNLNLVSADINFAGSNGTPLSIGSSFTSFFPGGGVEFISPQGTVDLTTSNGTFTGASFNLIDSSYHAPFDQFAIGPGGDSFAYQFATTGGVCQNYVDISPSGGGIYKGDTINPCTVQVSNNTPGGWLVTRAPEIDPASAASGLTLLLGGLAVLRGRWKIERSTPDVKLAPAY